MRRGIRPPAGWNTTHDRWARGLRFDQPAAQEAFDAPGAVQTRDVQLRSLDTKIDDWSTREPLREPVARLEPCAASTPLGGDPRRRGVRLQGLCQRAGVRWASPGWLPRSIPRGREPGGARSPKPGTSICRVLVEAAWSYRHRPAIGYQLRRRQHEQPQAVLTHSWIAQQRLHTKFVKVAARHERNVAVVAVCVNRGVRLGADDRPLRHRELNLGLGIDGRVTRNNPRRNYAQLHPRRCAESEAGSGEATMCGSDPRISVWPITDPTCPVAVPNNSRGQASRRSIGGARRISGRAT